MDKPFSGMNSIVGLGVRPVRAGSIGREPLGSCKYTGFPPKKAGSFMPAPSTKKPVPHNSKRIGLAPRPWERCASPLDFPPAKLVTHPSLNGYPTTLDFSDAKCYGPFLTPLRFLYAAGSVPRILRIRRNSKRAAQEGSSDCKE